MRHDWLLIAATRWMCIEDDSEVDAPAMRTRCVTRDDLACTGPKRHPAEGEPIVVEFEQRRTDLPCTDVSRASRQRSSSGQTGDRDRQGAAQQHTSPRQAPHLRCSASWRQRGIRRVAGCPLDLRRASRTTSRSGHVPTLCPHEDHVGCGEPFPRQPRSGFGATAACVPGRRQAALRRRRGLPTTPAQWSRPPCLRAAS